MFNVELEAERLRESLTKLDKLCGNLEPSNRKLALIPFEGKLYVAANDGCLHGYFELAEHTPQPIFPPFEVPLDIVKQFVSELRGLVTIVHEENLFTLKAEGEVLRLRTAKLQKPERYLEDLSRADVLEWYTGISKRRFTSDLDLVSSFLEEGARAEIHLSAGSLEMCSSHGGILSYTTYELSLDEQLRGMFDGFGESLSVPYVTARHVLKVLELETSDSLDIAQDRGRFFLRPGNLCGALYSFCGDRTELPVAYLRDVTKQIRMGGHVQARALFRVLRRSLVVGRASEVELVGEPGALVAFAQHPGITYRATVDAALDIRFRTRVRAYFLRSALNRLGSQNILVGLSGEFLLLFTPSLTRFVLLLNRWNSEVTHRS